MKEGLGAIKEAMPRHTCAFVLKMRKELYRVNNDASFVLSTY